MYIHEVEGDEGLGNEELTEKKWKTMMMKRKRDRDRDR